MQSFLEPVQNMRATACRSRRRTLTPLLAGTLVALGIGYGTAGERFSNECALRDVQTLIKFEQHGEAKELPADQIAAAFFTMQQARAMCGEQRVTEALELYDRGIRSFHRCSHAKIDPPESSSFQKGSVSGLFPL